MIHLPDWAGYLTLTVCFGAAALLINWGHARDTLNRIRHATIVDLDDSDDDREPLDPEPEDQPETPAWVRDSY